jgi:hypothetical protein
MKWVQWIMLAALATASTGCKKGKTVLRDPEVYKNEIGFLQMALEQDTELLEAHLKDGSCSCDEDGAWNNETCEMSALNVLVVQARLGWHVDMMMYLGGLSEERPPEDPPEVAEPSTLCPGD